ncbi:LysM peptidoglycan-binding domain-containing protein [Lacinutrix neustonica]|uniref:LysM peptidoglycan-binding domain-containing protein n=1 Tax=Lacinutrix neustonica TaxID=2980107 RepID=A0A9E8SDW5_9FLAO|nr:LysM peptidoglycan-binding domain-containing protein [Lacinutrix neustonica]WAC02868.1 LysM peptidoglycan-binding domain-containing protein [Lacinutrix neustonica]
MKLFFIILLSFLGMYASAQSTDTLDVTIDDRPAKLNTKTGKFIFTDKAATKSPVDKAREVSQPKTLKNNLHTVAKGDTFYSISKYYGISIPQLKSLNDIKDNNLEIGQQLKIGYSQKAMVSNSKTHTVTNDDTLYSISKRYTISISDLKGLNHLNTDAIHVGQVLKLK